MAKVPSWALNRGTKDEVEPGVIVRHNDDGTIDEVLFGAGGAFFHLEQMDDNCYWIGVSWVDDKGASRMQHLTLSTARARIYPTTYR